jgi:hypothetical protein
VSTKSDRPYAKGGNKHSQQAEPSSANRGAATTQMRILVELQVISMLLKNAYEVKDSLRKLRQDVADSIT